MRRELMTSLLALLTVGFISCLLYLHHINNLEYTMKTDRSFRELRHLILQLEKKKGIKNGLANPPNPQTKSMRPDNKRTTPRSTKPNEDLLLGNVSSGISGDGRPMKGPGDSPVGDDRGSEVNSVGSEVNRGVGSKKRYLVYLCDSRYACSGWGDRQRGVVAAYLLSLVTDRSFVVNMTSPCNVRKFLEPNQYNWDIPASELAGKSSVTIGGVRDTAFHKMFRYQDVNRMVPQDVIYLRSSADLINAIKSNPHYKERLPDWTKTRRHVAFKNGWTLLMKPTKHLQNHIDNLLRTVNLKKEGSLVCAHVRIGKNPSVPNDSPNRNSVDSVESLWDFLDPFVKNASRIFIATDSLEIRAMARKRFGKKSLDSGGEILHIDRQRKRTVACDGFETVILEQLILTKCHVLVVSASNFSIRAAFLRGLKERLYMFRNSTVTTFSMGN